MEIIQTFFENLMRFFNNFDLFDIFAVSGNAMEVNFLFFFRTLCDENLSARIFLITSFVLFIR